MQKQKKKSQTKNKRNKKKRGKTSKSNMFVNESANEHYLCLLYQSLSEKLMTLAVIRVSNEGPSRESFVTLDHSPWTSRIGFGSLGTTCYLVGGWIDKQPLPCEVFLCDISKEEKKWELGPRLNYGKPDPIVFTVNEKLYVLAGCAMGTRGATYKNIFEVFDPIYGEWKLQPDPPFLSLFRRRFRYPMYLGHTVIGCVIYLQVSQSETDESPTLYSFNTENETWSQYLEDSGQVSFSPGSDEQILYNLRCSEWRGRRDVVDYMMFHTTEHELKNLQVYAFDLTSSLEDFKNRMYELGHRGLYFDDTHLSGSDDKVWNEFGGEIPEDTSDSDPDNILGYDPEDILHSDHGDISSLDPKDISNFIPLVPYEKPFRENDADENKEIECVENKNEIGDFNTGIYVPLVDENVPSIAVYGLTKIDRFIPQRGSLGSFVMHLRKNLFALVISFPSIDNDLEKYVRVKICTFEASMMEVRDEDKFCEGYVAAYNVNEMKWVKPGLGMLVGWCKVPNDGRQSQFRRPQKWSGREFHSYHDVVANQEIQKKDFCHDYVQSVTSSGRSKLTHNFTV